MDPDEIIAQFKKDDEAKTSPKCDADEIFPDEIKLISQPLAYRQAFSHDLYALHDLLHQSYSTETVGAEAFRSGDPISKNTIKDLLNDKSYKWLIVEAPSGREVELDGAILGVCCYSIDGVSRRNGQFYQQIAPFHVNVRSGVVEGSLGSIRLFAVLPRYHGFCVGRRLLQKAEDLMYAEGCCRVMVCVPSTRVSMLRWIERRNYVRLGSTRYPAGGIGHVLKEGLDVDLVQYIKTSASLLGCDSGADNKVSKVYSIVPSHSEHSIPCDVIMSSAAQDFQGQSMPLTDISAALSGHPPVQKNGNMTLPPLWRNLISSAEAPRGDEAETESLMLTSDCKGPSSSAQFSISAQQNHQFFDSEIPDVD